jgi:hypothetical protein
MKLLIGTFFLTTLMIGCSSEDSKVSSAPRMTRSASASAVVKEIFERHYVEEYRPRFCGINVQEFIRDLDNNGVDLSSFQVVYIENKGGSEFGMVKAESARTVRWNKPAAWVTNWEHHVIAIDSKTKIVYDFDYMVSPTLVKLDRYIESMFLDESACDKGPNADSYHACVGRDTKLDDYQWELIPAEDSLSKVEKNKKTVFMRDVLNRLP